MEIAIPLTNWINKKKDINDNWLIDDKPYRHELEIEEHLTVEKEEQYLLDYTNKIQAIEILFRESLLNLVELLHIQDEEYKNSLKISLNNELIAELPYQFEALHNSIEKSKYILELEENWDDEGSPPYKQSTWRRAIEFICNYTHWIFSKTNRIIDAPQIYHGPNGSIDILWKKENYRLLINIPEDPTKPASFYGDDYNQQQIQGTFDLSKYNQGLFLSLLLLA